MDGERQARQGAVRLEIAGLAGGGDGVGWLDGKAVFVPLAAPGDTVEAALVDERRAWSRARLLRIVHPSPDRVLPPCPLFGDCGGCNWQHLAYATQLDAKRTIVAEALQRIGHLEAPEPAPTVPSPREYGYRHRALVHAQARGGGLATGFYRRASRDIVPFERCPVLHPSLDAAVRALREAAAAHPGAFAAVGQARADASWDGGAVRLLLRVRGGGEAPVAPAGARALREAASRAGVELLLGEGEGALALAPGEDALLTTGEAFTQVNLGQNPALVATALELAAVRPGEEALDLCCGLGNLALPLAARGVSVLGVDLDAAAVRQAEANASRLGRAARFHAADAAAAARELAGAGRRFDLVVLNPPRIGAREAARALPALGASRVVVVSCDPATLARDGAELAAAGYRLDAVRPLDLFPQTAHVETVARFSR